MKLETIISKFAIVGGVALAISQPQPIPYSVGADIVMNRYYRLVDIVQSSSVGSYIYKMTNK
jgi:hypothetical protein